MVNFVVAVVLASISLTLVLGYLKLYQLGGYRLRNFIKNVFNYRFSYRKSKLKVTARIKRFIVIYTLFLIGIYFVLFYFMPNFFYLILYAIMVLPISIFNIMITHIFMFPFESMIKFRYIHIAKKYLRTRKLIRIGITGSYGKTTTKNILRAILREKYKVCVSPESFNTPMGVCRTILEHLKNDDEVLILEMGARNIGDIKYLCKICPPDYGIITSVGPQHLETFKSLENVEKTKFELYEKTKTLTIFGEGAKSLLKKAEKNNSIAVGAVGNYCYATFAELQRDGMSFTLSIAGELVDFKCKLLGRHNLQDIICAVALAKKLGLKNEQIQKGIENVKATPHRLELIQTDYLSILDDSYNSNEFGANEALNTLKLFTNQKFIITPGFVELGKFAYDANFRLGQRIAEVCDYAIIMNETNKDAIYEGLISKNFNESKIFFKNKLEDAMAIVKAKSNKGDAVLFENDLPDNFK